MSETHQAQPVPVAPPPAPAKPGNGLATAGFVLGLLGVLGSFIPVINVVAIVVGVVGAVLAAVGLVKSKSSGAGKKLAVSGIVLGVLAVIIGVVVNVAFAKVVDDALDETTGNSVEAPANDAANDASDDAAADEPAADAAGTTRENPAPLGSAITGGDWTVTINSVTTADADSLGSKPEAGSTLLVVNLTATYNGTDSQGSTPWATVEFVTAEGNTIDGLDGSTLFVADKSFDSLTSVYAGASVTGNRIYEVPADGWQAGVLAVSPDLLSDSTFVAVK